MLHFASPASPIDYLRLPLHTLKVGAYGTHNMLGLAKAHRSRFLLASTSEVYGDPHIHPQPESYWGNVNPIGPRGVYDEAKRYAEALTMAYHRQQGVDTAIVRIFNTYGPRMRAHDGRAIPTFVRQALSGEPITVFGDGGQTRSFCYVDDLVDGILRLAESGEHLPVNIGNPEEFTLLELAEKVITPDRFRKSHRLRGAARERSQAAPPRHHARRRAAGLGAPHRPRRRPAHAARALAPRRAPGHGRWAREAPADSPARRARARRRGLHQRLGRPEARALGADAARRDGRRAARQRPRRRLPGRAAAAPAGHPLRRLVGAHRAAQAGRRDRIPTIRPTTGRSSTRWSLRADALGVPVLLTIEVTPRWAGGGTGNKAPVNMASLQAFAYAAATRYSGQHIVPVDRAGAARRDALGGLERAQHDEPPEAAVQLPLRDAPCRSSPAIYAKILTAIYKGVHSAGTHAGVIETVAGGATKPNYSGPKTFEPAVAPLRFLLLLGKKHPPLDVYSHHPYRTDVGKKAGQLPGPNDIAFADLPRLIKGLDTAFPGKHLHLWITEFGLQTNPPDGFQGVSLANQSQQLRRNVAASRANPRIDMLIWFLIRDEQVRKPFAAGFQTGLSFTNGTAQAGLVGLPLARAVAYARQSTTANATSTALRSATSAIAPHVEVGQVVEREAQLERASARSRAASSTACSG